MAGPELILNRNLMPDHVPRYRILELELPDGGHPYAWSRIWMFALTFDPHAYSRDTGLMLDAPELARGMVESLPTEGRVPGDLAELRAVLHWMYWQGGQEAGLPRGNVIVEAVLDAIYARVSGGRKRPAGKSGPYEPGLGTCPVSVSGTSGQQRFCLTPRRETTRESLHDAVAGLLLRDVDERAYISALYLYPPAYSVENGERGPQTFSLLLGRRRRGSSGRITNEYDRLTRLAVTRLADRSKYHYPQ